MFRKIEKQKEIVWRALQEYRDFVKEGNVLRATAAMAKFRQVLGMENLKCGSWSHMEHRLMEETDEEYLVLLNSSLEPDRRITVEEGSSLSEDLIMPNSWMRT